MWNATRIQQAKALVPQAIPVHESEGLAGPFSVSLLGRKEREINEDGPILYSIALRGCHNKASIMYRRYNHFDELRREMVKTFPELPEMPPKSIFRSRFSPSFKADRDARLRYLLLCAVSSDPLASCPALRNFLGLGATHPHCLGKAAGNHFGSVGSTASGHSWSLNSIAESDEDEEDDKESNRGALERIVSGMALSGSLGRLPPCPS